MINQELEHFGVKGMKWGVRRTPAQLGHRQEKKLKRKANKLAWKAEKYDQKWASDLEYETSRPKRPGEVRTIAPFKNRNFLMSLHYEQKAYDLIDKIYPKLADLDWDDIEKEMAYEDIKGMKVPKWARK